jgi:hypothetical protein
MLRTLKAMKYNIKKWRAYLHPSHPQDFQFSSQARLPLTLDSKPHYTYFKSGDTRDPYNYRIIMIGRL